MRSLPFVLLLMSCAGTATEVRVERHETVDATGSETAANTSGVRTRSADEIPTPPTPWDQMTMEAKGHYMGEEVLPYMRTLFQEFDPQRYARFGCADCHGHDMAERNFAMPNPDILPLHDSGTDAQRAMVAEHPQMVRFMFNHVVPAMRQMVGGEPYDAETGEGFGCFDCHTHAEALPAPLEE